MNITKFIAVFCLLQSAFAEESLKKQKQDDLVGSMSTSYFREYLARPGAVLFDGPVIQNDISVSYRGLYAGMWSSTALEESQTTKYGLEFQPYVGYKKSIGWVVLDSNVRYDALKELSSAHDDLWMADLRLDVVKMPIIQPYIATRYFHAVETPTPTPGLFVWFGAKYVRSTPFALRGSSPVRLGLDSMVAYSSGALSRDSGWVYGRFVTQVIVPVGKRISITPQFTIQVPLDSHEQGAHPYTDGRVKFVPGITANLRF